MCPGSLLDEQKRPPPCGLAAVPEQEETIPISELMVCLGKCYTHRQKSPAMNPHRGDWKKSKQGLKCHGAGGKTGSFIKRDEIVFLADCTQVRSG